MFRNFDAIIPVSVITLANDCQPTVCIIIKALNEETNIARAVESSLAALEGLDGSVILADARSDDRTIEVASDYDISIVRLKYPNDRSCGAGPQLGYQVAMCDFVYILDGDMELEPGFIRQALDHLRVHPELAAVGGFVTEMNVDNYTFENRNKRNTERTASIVDHLGMGGLYRTRAIRDVGYFSNRNLHAYEELELGLRLINKGWRLQRIAVSSVRHYGYREGNGSLFRRRWRSGYLRGSGELLRASFGKTYFKDALKHHAHLVVVFLVWLVVFSGIILLPAGNELLIVGGLLWLVLLLVLIAKKRSVKGGMLSFVIWHQGAMGMIRGLAGKQVDPRRVIEFERIA